MQTRRRELFTTIRTEGALLPPDLLQRIADGDRELEGLTPEAYHLAANERLGDAVTRAWNRLVGAWAGFGDAVAKLPENDLATSVTRERWLLILFHELGYGRLPTARAVELDGKSYAVSHAWESVPVHLVGARVPLDRRTAGVAGAAGQSPHGLLQELLNRSEERLWGFVSNGLVLRVLRDNSSLTRQAYVEFDLEAMMDGEVYSDFVVLWLLCHESRVEGERPELSWLERWSKLTAERGTRALESLRAGVEEAIAALGRGFLAHPANRVLRDALRAGELSTDDYYRQLLRLVYRLLFLFVAEDRELLLAPDAPQDVRERYARFFSTQRLRWLAERRRGGRHGDLYEGLRLVMRRLGEDDGCAELGLPPLGSFLWSREAVPDLDGAQLPNEHLLGAVRALAFIEERGTRRAVDYKNLGSEELGSVYESLLELRPELDVGAATFVLTTVSGSERKTTGSYYTPTSLINALLESALDPLLNGAAAGSNPEAAILGLKVCDPACGSGHFLVAASHRIAKRLASVRTGDEEPSPEATRTALRDVIGRCVYGVDINEMAVELCKVSLWMEALEPGRPLSFLDGHVRQGNSLLGSTPVLVAEPLPDSAFQPIEGDDNGIARELRDRNRRERAGQIAIEEEAVMRLASQLEDDAAAIEALGDESIASIRAKEKGFDRLRSSPEYAQSRLLADTWCAAFFVHKSKDAPVQITQSTLRKLAADTAAVAEETRGAVAALRDEYRFFHWHVEFPDVFHLPETDEEPDNPELGWSGGFDLVLGNPPWDTLSPDVKEFFSPYDPDVRFQDREGQQVIVDRLLGDPVIAKRWEAYCRRLYSQAHFFKRGGRYRLFAPGNLGKGDFNVYRMFVETALQAARGSGAAAQIVPDGFYMGANAAAIRAELFERCELSCLYGFENWRETWFRDIDSRTKFCLYAALMSGSTKSFRAAFNLRSEQDLSAALAGLNLEYPVTLVREFSPDALAVMEFASQFEIDIVTKAYGRWPKFGDEAGGPPHRLYMAEIHMGNDRELFGVDDSGLPLQEGRMVAQFDHRAKGYVSGRGRSAVWEDYQFDNPSKRVRPQWFVARGSVPAKARERVGMYRIGFCDVASPTNERSLVASLIPPNTICGDKVPTISFEDGYSWAYMLWLAVANSVTMDFIVRKKISLKMSYTVLDSLPFPRLEPTDPVARRIVPIAAALTCTSPEMTPFWNELADDGWIERVADGQIPGITDEERRREAQAELDAIVARDLYGFDHDELSFILDTFPIVRRQDEQRFGEFRTKRIVLSSYDALVSRADRERALELAAAEGKMPQDAGVVSLSPPASQR